MPLLLSKSNANGTRDFIIVLGPDNIERIKEKDPVEINFAELPFQQPIRSIVISHASDPEITQITQLIRQGKTSDAIDLVTAGWQYRPDKGDHDLGYQRL